MSGPLEVVLVEPYGSGSHLAWAEGYARHSSHRVRLVTHEGAFWRWRMRGAALTLAEEVAALARTHGPPDVLVVSGMVHLPAMLGLARRSIGDPAVALYLHENQLLYPPAPDRRRGGRPTAGAVPDEEMGLVNWLSMVAADHVFVNSQHHRSELLAALAVLVGRAPDHNHTGHLEAVAARTSVLPVGVELAALLASPRPASDGAGEAPPLVVWNQRWEHDKDPEVLLRALVDLAAEGVAFRLALAGENVRVDPREFRWARERLGDRVVHEGLLPRSAYVELLGRADVVVSTALHEFFGIAVVEAVAAGAVPLLPDRLSYPEIVPERFHRAALYAPGELVGRLRALLVDLSAARRAVEGLRGEMARFDWEVVAPAYDEALARLAAGGSPEEARG